MWTRTGYRQCVRCVMDTSDPEIVFDDKGQCNHCTEYAEKLVHLIYQGESSDKDLKIIVDRIKKAGRKSDYDCVIGVSGGIDSSYVAYVAKKWGLRPLAVHLDNGWNSEEAVKNIKSVCTMLDIDYQSYVLDWEEFRDIQLAFLRASIVEMEIPTDVAIPGALHRVAAENKVKCILSGGNHATEGIMPKCWFYYPKDARLLKAISQRFGTRKVKSFPTFDYMDEMYYKFIHGIRIIYPLNYVPYSKSDAVQLLKDELNWVDYGGKHNESMFTKMVLNYIQPTKFNVDYRRATFSTQICTGSLTREAALAELEKSPYDPETIDEEKQYVAKKLGISALEFEDILNLPLKSYRDYPNDEKLLRFIYDAYRKIFKTTRSYSNADYR